MRDSYDSIDRSACSVVSLTAEDDERAYWWAQTPEARLRHMEWLRRLNYGDRAGERLQIVFEVVKLGSD